MWWWNLYSWHNYFVTTIKFLATKKKLKRRWPKCPCCNKLLCIHFLLLQYTLLPQTLCCCMTCLPPTMISCLFHLLPPKMIRCIFHILPPTMIHCIFHLVPPTMSHCIFHLLARTMIRCSTFYCHQQMNVAIVTLATKFVTLQDFFDAMEDTTWQYGVIATLLWSGNKPILQQVHSWQYCNT